MQRKSGIAQCPRLGIFKSSDCSIGCPCFSSTDTSSSNELQWLDIGVMCVRIPTLIARFMGPTWGPPGDDRTQVGPMLATWTLLSGNLTLFGREITKLYGFLHRYNLTLTRRIIISYNWHHNILKENNTSRVRNGTACAFLAYTTSAVFDENFITVG